MSEQSPKTPDDSSKTEPGRAGLWLEAEPGDSNTGLDGVGTYWAGSYGDRPNPDKPASLMLDVGSDYEEEGLAAETDISSLVEDVDRAWDMAYAVKPIRDDIAEVRASGKGHAERFVRTGDTTSRKLAEQTIGLINKLDRKANKVEDKVGRRYDKGQDLLRQLGVRSSEES